MDYPEFEVVVEGYAGRQDAKKVIGGGDPNEAIVLRCDDQGMHILLFRFYFIIFYFLFVHYHIRFIAGGDPNNRSQAAVQRPGCCKPGLSAAFGTKVFFYRGVRFR